MKKIKTAELNEPSTAPAQASETGPEAPQPVSAAELLAASEVHGTRIAEISGLEHLLNTNSTALAALELDCFLEDRDALAEIGRRQIMAGILPKRIQAQQDALFESGRNLVELCWRFVSLTLSPRVNAFRTSVAASVRKNLAAHLSNEFLLNQAVLESDAVVACNHIYCTLDGAITPDTVRTYIVRLLESWQQITKLEKTPLEKMPKQETYTDRFTAEQRRRTAALSSSAV